MKNNFVKKITENINVWSSGHDREYLVDNLSLLVGSGLTVPDALSATMTGVKTKTMTVTVEKIKDDVESGVPLWRAMEKTKIFKSHIISLIKVGEETGRLASNLKVVRTEQQKELDLRSKVRSAMIYPIFVFCLTGVVALGIAWFVLPRITQVFTQMSMTLPLITKILIWLGDTLEAYGMIIIPVALVMIFLTAFFLFYFSLTKFLGQRLLFVLPGIGRLMQEVELARFGYLLGLLLEAGLPIIQAIKSLAAAASFYDYQVFYEYLANEIDDGRTFNDSFLTYPKLKRLVPVSVQQLIVTGERSGNLAGTLLSIGATYEAKSDITAKNLSVILEPILLVLVASGVIAVALSVILPVYSLIGGLSIQ